jgi:hypothetical protein
LTSDKNAVNPEVFTRLWIPGSREERAPE